MDTNYSNIINNIKNDIDNSISKNLENYLIKLYHYDNVVEQLKKLLYNMPEFKKLQDDYEKLNSKYNSLLEKNVKIQIHDKNKDIKNIILSESNLINQTQFIQEENEEEGEEEGEEENEEEGEEEGEEENEEENEVEEEEEENEVEEEEENEEEGEEENEENEVEEEEEENEENEVEEEEGEEEEEENEEEENEEEGEEEEEEEDNEEEGEEEGEEEEDELIEINVNGKDYYLNELNNELYEILKDGEPGNIIGKLVNKKIINI